MKPIRVQLKRVKGWRMPPNTVKVSRPSRWGNPFIVKFDPHTDYSPQTNAEAVSKFRAYLAGAYPHLLAQRERLGDVRELAGKNLACFCKLSEPCHADVLLEIANS